MRYLKVLCLVALFFVSMLFFVQNTDVLVQTLTLQLALLSWHVTSAPVPHYLLILLAFVGGAILPMIYFLCEKIRLSKELRGARKMIKKQEEELNSLRNMPIEDAEYATTETIASDSGADQE
ncbi:MAG: LapA family protein [Desulfoplanes sp.]|jgi:putative membrane protein